LKPGGGLVDVDGDGWLDVVLVNSGPLPGFKGARGAHALYLNNRKGGWRNVTGGSGLRGPAYGMGLAAGDYDGDGKVDLYLTGLAEGRLYRNLGGGRFQDVTTPAVRNAGHWGTSASWTDVDRDGRLDLFIGNYVRWSVEKDTPCNRRGFRVYCGPGSYPADHCVLLANQGGGRFIDRSREAGVAGAPAKALGVKTCDIDTDGAPDLLVACDLVANLLFRNRGGGAYEEIGIERGVAMDDRGLARAGMGIAAHEEDPGRWSVWIGNLTKEGTAYYRQSEDGSFADAAASQGLHPGTLNVLTFGLVAQDLDRDGYLDLALSNGHIDLLAEKTRDEAVLQPALLFRRQPDGRLVDVTAGAGPPFQGRYMGRGLACGDVDNDGDLDLLLIENNGPARLWRNDAPASSSWLGLDCRWGASGSTAVGARVAVTCGGRTQVRWVGGDGSYLSASDPRVFFGLGAGPQVDAVEVRWPDGRTERHTTMAPGKYWRLEPGRSPEPASYAASSKPAP